MPGPAPLRDGVVTVLQEGVLARHSVTREQLDALCKTAQEELERRERRYRRTHPPPVLEGRSIVLVDDGIATGATIRAAITIVRAQHAARVIVAAPVGAPDSCAALRREADVLVCPMQPPSFCAVSQWYRAFPQTTDEEVIHLLSRAWRDTRAKAACNEEVPGP